MTHIHSKKFAVDIVLLPPDGVIQRAIAVNRQLASDKIRLNQTDCLPHVSLLMGCVAEADIPVLHATLREISETYLPLLMVISKIACIRNRDYITSFDIERSSAIQSLHARIVEQIAPHLTYNATADMFYQPPQVNESAIQYVTTFLAQASHEKFWPHMTLGYGKHAEERMDVSFTATRLAVCHLGAHCTCRKILAE